MKHKLASNGGRALAKGANIKISEKQINKTENKSQFIKDDIRKYILGDFGTKFGKTQA